jgi:uncharacterized membrane protein
MDERLLNNLIDRLDRIEQRLSLLEKEGATSNYPRATPTPPPFAHQANPTVIPPTSHTEPPTTTKTTTYKPQRVSNEQARQNETDPSSEYLIGAKILPWAGAILLIICITTFVTLAYRQGMITKEHIFGLATTICLGFIGAGQRLRDAKEQFGHLLTGLGSAGLYITFAAGHFAQGIYSNTIMIGLFVALSFINLAYSYWRESTAFLIIGSVGGYIAAILPISQGDIGSNLLLGTLITVPISLIISRHRWTVLSYLIIPSAILVFSFGLIQPGFEWQKVGVLILTALLGSYAYAAAWLEKETNTDQGVFLILSLAGVAWITFEVIDGPWGSLHIITYGLLLAALSIFTPKNLVTTRIQQAALFIPFLVAPWGASKPQAVFILAALAIAASVVSNKVQPRTISVLSGIVAILSVIAYIVTLVQNKIDSDLHNLALLTVLILSVPIASISLSRNYPKNRDQVHFVSGFITAITVTMFLFISSGINNTLSSFQGLVITLTLVSVLFHVLSRVLDSLALKLVGSFWSFALTLVISAPLILGRTTGLDSYLLLNLVVLAHWFVIYRLYISAQNKTPKDENEAVIILLPSALLIWDSISQLLQLPSAGFDLFNASLYSSLITLIIFASFALRTKMSPLYVICTIGGHSTFAILVLHRIYLPIRPIASEILLTGLATALSFLLSRFQWDSKEPRSEHLTSQTATFQISFFALYAGLILTANDPIAWTVHRSLIIWGAAIISILLALHHRLNRPYHLIPAWAIWILIAITTYNLALQSIPAVGLVLATQILLAFAGDKLLEEQLSHRALHCFLGSAIATQLGTLVFTHPAINLPVGPAITTSWAILATVALVAGFWARITALRHTGLVLLFLAGAKVIFFDLASTSELVRVGVTFILGLAMIGGGYLYIRLQSRLDPVPKESPGQPSQ